MDEGDVTYWLPPYESTMDQCGRHCTKMPNCKSFSHSWSDNLCKLMLKEKITGNGLYEKNGLYGAYQYCTKGIFNN